MQKSTLNFASYVAVKCKEHLSDNRSLGENNLVNIIHSEVPSEGRSVILKRQALAALFISVSPNLESLTLCPMVVTTSPATFPMRTVSTEQFIKSRGYYIRESSPLIEFLDRVNFNIVKTEALQHVRHLKFDFDKLRFRHAYNSFTLLENLNLVHRLPHLESIRIAAMTEIHPEDFELWNSYYEQATVRPCSNSSNINKIHLENSYVGTRYLEYLIDICKRLTKFTYWTGPVPELYRSNPRFFGVIALKTLARALLSQRHNLETLDLVIDDAYADFDTEEPPLQHQPYLGGQNHGTESDNLTENLTGAGGILVHFTSLTRLTLNVRLFFYFAMGVRPITMGGQDLHGSQGARSQSYRPAGAGQSLEHDDRTDMHEDLEVNHMPGSKDERYQPLIKTLPPRLEYLCICGYHRGLNTFHDSLLSSLMTDIQEEGLLPHLNVSGVW